MARAFWLAVLFSAAIVLAWPTVPHSVHTGLTVALVGFATGMTALNALVRSERQKLERLIADCDAQNAAYLNGDWDWGLYGYRPISAVDSWSN